MVGNLGGCNLGGYSGYFHNGMLGNFLENILDLMVMII
jgi:hypothetical protein